MFADQHLDLISTEGLQTCKKDENGRIIKNNSFLQNNLLVGTQTMVNSFFL